jgi:simple sugar transport system permease protein
MIAVYGTSPYTLVDNFSPGYGFDAIAVALLGRNTVLGTLLAAVLFGALQHGANIMQANANVSLHLVEILQGLIIFFVAADAIVRYLARRGTIRMPRWQRQGAAA